MQQALGHADQTGQIGKPLIWGTGLIGGGRFKSSLLDFAAVRGPLTQTLLELGPMPLGDPGLLASRLLDRAPKRTDKIGVVFHYAQTIPPDLLQRLTEDDRFSVINVQSRDPVSVVSAIASCRHVFSSSLYGLIVADAFGVPNTWLDPDGIRRFAVFRFHDYALSVRRLLNDPVKVAGLLAAADSLPSGIETVAYLKSVAERRADLLDSFPHARLQDLADSDMEKA